jgi:hypothetical protein
MTLDELRALATDDMGKKVLDFEETLQYLRDTADAIGKDGDVSVKKRLLKINTLMGEGVKAVKLLEGRFGPWGVFFFFF